MASYGYGPPPPAPPLAQPSHAGYAQYSQPYQQQPVPHGGQSHRGGRGGHHSAGRGDYQGASYGYGPQPPSYAQHTPPNSFHGAHPPQGGYPPPQWQHGQPQSHSHQPAGHAPLPPQNYHPNYAPQIYQQQQPYSQQTAYPPPAQQQQGPYGPQYGSPSQPPNGPPSQQWGPSTHPPQNSPHFGSGRGRGGHHHERGGAKTQMMGPPIRIGFDSGSPQDHAAPVSNGYPSQSFGPPHGGPAPFAGGPYQSYPPNGPPQAGGPPPYDPYFSQNSRAHGRGGFHNNAFRNRSHHSGDKMRHKKPASNASVPNAHHQKPDAASVGKKKKRKTNTLGLTPGEESEDDDDVDEEAKLLELIGPDAPNPTDIAAWVAERKRNFPTQARVKAKLAAASNSDTVKSEGLNKDSAASSLEKQQQKAEKLRKQLEKVESSIKRKREQQDEGDEMRDVDASTLASSDARSEDEGPEALSTRPEPTPLLPPPPKKADPSKHCKYFSTGGTCGKKGKCRFVHDSAVREAALKEREMNGGRMTLQQRLTLNDKDQEDLTIVKTLQYLKEKGMMKDCAAGAAASNTSSASSTSANTSYLPPPPVKAEQHHSLPAQPPPSSLSSSHTVRYQGWNLSGFGNTGVKSGDL